MGLPILFALLSMGQGDPQPVRTVETAEKIGSIKVPDEIAPAIGPYITCRIMASGTPLIVEGKPVSYNLPGQTDCAKVRENAIREADKLLVRQGMDDKAKRQAFVEKAMADADSFVATLSNPQSFAVAPEPAHAKGEAKIVRQSEYTMVPRDIAPALEPYMDCTTDALNDELADGGVSTGAAFREVHATAVAACAAERVEAKAAALSLLSASRMTAPAREKFVEAALLAIETPSASVIDRLNEGQVRAAARREADAQ